MPTTPDPWHQLASGQLALGQVPLRFDAVLCDLRPRFIDKGRAGREFRAIARNGRVLIASQFPLSELPELTVSIRVQLWHKIFLPGDEPAPYGILLYLSDVVEKHTQPSYGARLTNQSQELVDLGIDVGGGMSLTFAAK